MQPAFTHAAGNPREHHHTVREQWKKGGLVAVQCRTPPPHRRSEGGGGRTEKPRSVNPRGRSQETENIVGPLSYPTETIDRPRWPRSVSLSLSTSKQPGRCRPQSPPKTDPRQQPHRLCLPVAAADNPPQHSAWHGRIRSPARPPTPIEGSTIFAQHKSVRAGTLLRALRALRYE